MAEYQVFARKPDLTKDFEITRYSKLEMILRFNQSGSWTLSGTGDLPLMTSHGIIVYRDGIEFFSGIIRQDSSQMDADRFLEREWTYKGIDDLGRLSNRIAVPDPINWNFTTTVYDTRTGPAETVILDYVNYNCGQMALTRRQFPNFQVASSSGLGLTTPGNARFTNLLDLIYNIAQRGGSLGYRVHYDSGVGKLIFEVYQPSDLTSKVKFSADFGNLKSFKHQKKAPKANYIIVLGQGSGTSRSSVDVYDQNSIDVWELVETVKDQRNEPDAAKLADWGTAELGKQNAQEGFNFEPNDLPGVGFTFKQDYDLGDLVSVADDGNVLHERVTEVKISVDDQGFESIVPTIGQLKDIPLSTTFEKVDDLENRVDTIETSQ
jgi:hypothetical protein